MRREDDTRRVGRETLDNCPRRGRWSGPDEEYRTCASQPCVERFRHSEVAGDDFDVLRQHRRRLGAMCEGADRHAHMYQLIDYGAPNPTGRSDHEHRRDAIPSHIDLDFVPGLNT